jgi:alpha-glucoside transport system permease protein
MGITSGAGPVPVAGQASAKPPKAYRERRFNPITLFFILPALLLLLVFLMYPTIYTLALSLFRGRQGSEFAEFVGLRNYEHLLFRDPNFINLSTFPPSGALWNNLLWIVFYTGFVIFLGLVIAVLASRVRYESLIKSIVFVPMAIAATALAVIWRFVYSPDPNVGLINALLQPFGIGPVPFLGTPELVNWALITVGIWGSVGFATVILSAALKSIPSEILEAARVDGASERQIFTRIIVPMVSLPMSVVAVTLIVNVIKLFDLILVMTTGGPGATSRVIAYTMYVEAFPGGQLGRGAAVAMIMVILLLPIMIYNVRRFRTGAVT